MLYMRFCWFIPSSAEEFGKKYPLVSIFGFWQCLFTQIAAVMPSLIFFATAKYGLRMRRKGKGLVPLFASYSEMQVSFWYSCILKFCYVCNPIGFAALCVPYCNGSFFFPITYRGILYVTKQFRKGVSFPFFFS